MGIRSISGESIETPRPGLAARSSPLEPLSHFLKDIPTVSDLKKIVKAVIPAAGFGTRMLRATRPSPRKCSRSPASR
jgi:hypothetical protein